MVGSSHDHFHSGSEARQKSRSGRHSVGSTHAWDFGHNVGSALAWWGILERS